MRRSLSRSTNHSTAPVHRLRQALGVAAADSTLVRRWRSPIRWSLGQWSLVILLGGLAWRFTRYILVYPLWGDEAFLALNFFDRDLAGLFGELEFGMVAPVGFLASVLGVTELLGRSEWALRLLPWLAGIAALCVFWRLSRSLLGRHAALIAFAIFAASYYPVRHAAEVKPYSFDLLFSLLILWAVWSVLRAPRPGRLWIWLGGLTAAAVWFSYPAAFVAGGAYLVLGWRVVRERRRREIMAWLICGACLAASFAAMYALAGSKQQWSSNSVLTAGAWADHFPPLAEPWRIPLWLVAEHTGRMFAYPNGGPRFGSTLTTVAVVMGGIALWQWGRKELMLLLLSALPFMFIAAALYRYPYGGSARTTQILAGPICLLAGAGVVAVMRVTLPPRLAVTGVRVFAGAMLVLIAGSLIRDVVKPYKTIDDVRNREMVEWLAARTGAEDRWVVFGSFRHSPHGPDMTSWGGEAARMAYYLRLKATVPLLWAPDPTRPDIESRGRTWVIVFRSKRQEFPEEQWKAYRQVLTGRFGPPERHSFALGDVIPRAEVLAFGS